MAPSGQSSSWSNVLCCPVCSKVFALKILPINLSCGHTICRECLKELQAAVCPLDQTAILLPLEKLPPNVALLSVLSVNIETDPETYPDAKEEYSHIQSILVELAAYLHRAESERGGSVWSEELSRPMQRKLIALLCYQMAEEEGRQRALKTARGIAERALSELIICHQNTSSLSSNLWSAVRARGCQFLGPAMQDEVLKLVLLTLSEGALISRKTLVLYIVQTLRDDYPQVSKTCVGHVVQLLYRASCFNVIKREGESSLMQLKEEFRDYDALRREHDTQIVQVAFEAGLRISPDQWSALLYGDQQHRSHMQSIIDKLQSPQAFEQQIADLKAAIEQSSDQLLLAPTIEHFKHFANFDPALELPSWPDIVALFESLSFIVKAYVKFMRTRNGENFSMIGGNSRHYNLATCQRDHGRYKTRFCRDIEAGRICRRGSRCTYAHTKSELRAPVPQQLPPQPILNQYDDERLLIETAYPVIPPAPPPPLLASNAPVAPLQSLMNDCFIEPKKPPLNPVGNLVAPPPPPPPVPLMPVVIPAAANSSIPVPIVAAGIPNAEPQSAIDQNGAVVMVATPNQLPPHGQAAYVIPAIWPQTQTTTVPGPPVMASNVHQLFTMPVAAPIPVPAAAPIGISSMFPMHSPPLHLDSATVGFIPASGCLNDEMCTMQCGVPVESTDVPPQMQDGICRAKCENTLQNSYMSKNNEMDEEQLILRRHEILTRLECLQRNDATAGEDSIDDDDLQSHVSYTVARSVLYDEKEVATTASLELPPIPLHTAPPTEQTLNSLVKAVAVSTTVPTACPLCFRMNSPKPATVQASCTFMHTRDTISQPLPTPAIQRSHLPLAVEEDPSSIADHLPPVIRPLPATPSDPQNVVSDTLDKIMDVRERMNVVDKNGGLGCSAEKQQLKVELNIVSRQIQSLDDRTKQTCLLRELEAVDKKIENLTITTETTVLSEHT